MTKYLSNEEINLIEDIKDLYNILSHDMVELQTQEFILEAQKEAIKKAFFDFEEKKNSLIDTIVSTHGEGTVDLDKGTIEIPE